MQSGCSKYGINIRIVSKQQVESDLPQLSTPYWQVGVMNIFVAGLLSKLEQNLFDTLRNKPGYFRLGFTIIRKFIIRPV